MNYLKLYSVFLLVWAGTGCLTNTMNSSNSRGLSSSGITAEDPLAGLDGGGTLITLSRVVRSNSNPGSVFDLLGDGSGAFGKFCQMEVATGSSQSTNTPCTCEYTYVRASGAQESFEVPTSYSESNLLRCTFSGIPTGTSLVKIRVHLTAADTYSNEVTFRFKNTGVTLDLNDPNTFVRTQRFQCKDSIIVSNLFDSNVYDPFLSDDPALAYPLNFYTTNMARSISEFVKRASPSGGVGWNCPTTPNDSASGMDLTLYSLGADAAGSKLIYPPAQSAFDRSTFYLARSETGVFNVPVNAFIAPQVVTSAPSEEDAGNPDALPPPIGYGAAPTRFNDGEESCPDSSVPIPSGFKWVKIWQFRASLASRVVKTSVNLPRVGYIACNPGNWKVGASSGDPIVPDCTSTGMVTDPSGRLADRILGTGMCVHMNLTSYTTSPAGLCTDKLPYSGVGCTTNAAGASAGLQKTPANFATGSPLDYSLFAKGSDVWIPYETADDDGGMPCSSSRLNDPLNLCGKPYNRPVSSPATIGPVPHDKDSPMDRNVDQETSRFDILYVVTPVSIMTKNFKDGASGSADSVALPYVPYRFYTPQDCRSSDPDNPQTLPNGKRDCPTEKKIIYGFENRDATQLDNQPVTDPARSRAFPVCALQPI